MRWQPVRALVRKDLLAVRRNRGVWLPLVLTPVLALVVVPTGLVLGADLLSSVTLPGQGGAPLLAFGQRAEVTALAGTDAAPGARWIVFVLEVMLAPLFLSVPLIGATVIATHSFAGERDRGTMEGLLHTPVTEPELVTGKFLAAWIPAALISTVGFGVYGVLANVLAWGELGRVFFPTPMWVVLALFVSPGLSAFGLGLMVVASSRVRSSQAAHQIGSLVVLPIVVMLVGQIIGAMLLAPGLVVVAGAALWGLSLAVLAVGGRRLRRQRLVAPS